MKIVAKSSREVRGYSEFLTLSTTGLILTQMEKVGIFLFVFILQMTELKLRAQGDARVRL